MIGNNKFGAKNHLVSRYNVPVMLSSILLFFFFGQVSSVVQSDSNPNPQCVEGFPPIDFAAQEIDVLGDREKGNVCSLPRPWKLCDKVGRADDMCKKIARAVGGVSNATCSHKKVCKFLVKRPVQSPNTPGNAYVSLCLPEFAGVIFPCIANDLRIINPFYKEIGEPTDVLPEKVTEPVLNEPRCGEVDESVTKFIYNRKKIILPQNTTRGQFPWQAALFRKKSDEGDQYFSLFCGGSVISRQHILTAAHCFDDTDFKYKVILGDFNKRVVEDDEQPFTFGLNQIYIHSEYNLRLNENDVALVKVNGAIKFNKYVQPICLPSSSLVFSADLDCLISGWGNTERADTPVAYPNNLKAASVRTIGNDECASTDVYGEKFKERTMLCAGSLKGGSADSCQGDSGGPLICSIQDANNRQYQIQLGVVSWGDRCGDKNAPGVYSNIIKFRVWIDRTLERSIQNIGSIADKKVAPT